MCAVRITLLNDYEAPSDLPKVQAETKEQAIRLAMAKMKELGFEDEDLAEWSRRAKEGSWKEAYYGMQIEEV